MEQLVSVEAATAEVESWLDTKKVSQQKRDDRADGIKILISAICEGGLSLKEDKTFVQKLKHTFGKDVLFEELEYKPRIHVGLIHQHLSNVKSDDPDGRLLAHVAALTGKPKEVLKKMDTEDFAVAQSIAYFFL